MVYALYKLLIIKGLLYAVCGNMRNEILHDLQYPNTGRFRLGGKFTHSTGKRFQNTAAALEAGCN